MSTVLTDTTFDPAGDRPLVALAERAIALARDTKVDAARAALAQADLLPADACDAARLMLARAYTAYFSRAPADAALLAEQAEQMARAAGAPGLAARCISFAAACALRIDGEHRWKTVLDQLARARRLAAEPSDAPRAHLDRTEAEYLVDTQAGTIDQYAGRLDLALAAYARALRCCLDMGDVTGIGALRHRMAFTQSDVLRERWFEQRPHRADPWRPTATELADAMKLVKSSIEFAQVNGVPTNLPADQVQFGFLLMLDGHLELALTQLHSALAVVERARPLPGEAIYGGAVRCLCLLESGDIDAAEAACSALQATVDANASPNAMAYLWRARQWLCEARGDDAGAQAAFAHSQSYWRSYRELQRQIARALA